MKLSIKFLSVYFAVIVTTSLICAATAATEPEAPPPLITSEAEYDQQALIEKMENDARAKEFAILKQYEQADFDFMRGDAELDKKSNLK